MWARRWTGIIPTSFWRQGGTRKKLPGTAIRTYRRDPETTGAGPAIYDGNGSVGGNRGARRRVMDGLRGGFEVSGGSDDNILVFVGEEMPFLP
ncbi:hypothetical protein PG994_008103 [Apiospora phragmitis]|uniref:Uncharacterized protein n=1 Tax=Apiospora phragmitis TaxID=2905665 RepID=A0ABR1US57_9PEZI